LKQNSVRLTKAINLFIPHILSVHYPEKGENANPHPSNIFRAIFTAFLSYLLFSCHSSSSDLIPQEFVLIFLLNLDHGYYLVSVSRIVVTQNHSPEPVGGVLLHALRDNVSYRHRVWPLLPGAA